MAGRKAISVAVDESNDRSLVPKVRESHVFALEEQRSASLQSRLDQILDQLILPINGDPARFSTMTDSMFERCRR